MASLGDVIRKSDPLVNKAVYNRKKKKSKSSPDKLTYLPTYKGLPLIIEGAPIGSHYTGKSMSFKEAGRIKTSIEADKRKQAERKKITPIADPLAGVSERRRKAARQRMRGRLGTMLSERETLS